MISRIKELFNLEKLEINLLLFLILFVPFRNFFVITFGNFFKIIPDVIILLLLIKIFISEKEKKINKIDMIFILFLVFSFITTVFVNNLEISRFLIQTRSAYIFYPIYYIFRNRKLRPEEKKMIIKYIKFTLYTLFLFVILEKLFQKNFFFPQIWKDAIIYKDNFIRVYSLMNNPNIYAAYSLLTLIFLDIFEENFWSKKALPIFFVIFLGIILSVSRNTLILFIIYLMFLFYKFLIDKIKNYKIVIKFFAIIIASSTFILSINYFVKILNDKNMKPEMIEYTDDITIFARLKEITNPEIVEKSQTNGRLFVIEKGLEISKDYIFLGSGFGTFGSAASRILGSPLSEYYGFDEHLYSDNEYIKIFVETGIVGSLLLILFLSMIILSLNAGLINIFIMFVFLSFGMFYNVFEIQALSLLFWILISQTTKTKNEVEL